MKKIISCTLLDVIGKVVRDEFPEDTLMVFNLEFDDQGVMTKFLEDLTTLGFSIPSQMLLDEIVFVKMSDSTASFLNTKYNKSGIDIWTFKKGELVNETR